MVCLSLLFVVVVCCCCLVLFVFFFPPVIRCSLFIVDFWACGVYCSLCVVRCSLLSCVVVDCLRFVVCCRSLFVVC